MESAKVGKRGAIVVPAKLRKRFGIEEGTVVTAEEREDGILIRPALQCNHWCGLSQSAKRSRKAWLRPGLDSTSTACINGSLVPGC